jgi:hypothetical protein
LLAGQGGIASNAGQLTSTRAVTNELVTLAASGAFLELPDCANIDGTMTVTNRTSGATVSAGNYSVGTRVSATTGNKVLAVQTVASQAYASQPVNLTYTCLPQGYAEDAGARAISPLITLFASLAIAAIVIGGIIASGIFNQ